VQHAFAAWTWNSPHHVGLMKPCAYHASHAAQGRFFLGLVVIADAKLPIPSRTRPISAPTPMVLRLKTWESRSPPNLERNEGLSHYDHRLRNHKNADNPFPQHRGTPVAGWSSPVARQAHNLKVTGSNPVPATKILRVIKDFKAEHNARLLSSTFYINATSTPQQKNCTSVPRLT
jgi:hypothetical protein